jgi:hypothetical protein
MINNFNGFFADSSDLVSMASAMYTYTPEESKNKNI